MFPPSTSTLEKSYWQELKKLFTHSWIFFFTLICYVLYEHSLVAVKERHSSLTQRVEKLRKKKADALQVQMELKEKIENENDPLCIELLLKSELGVVASGEKKIFFALPRK